jgi:glycosyltransferase involved in cell wall biosynthesis
MSTSESTPALDGISVVIPTKNRAALLQQTLRSVGEQSLPASEVIVADDGSTDHTEEVVRAFGARHVLNVKGDWGAAAARNEGIRVARTQYIAFIDSDDLYRPRALERLHEALANRDDAPFAFGCGLAARLTPSGWESNGVMGPRDWELKDFLCSLYARNSIPSGGGLVRRDAALALGGFDQRSVHAEDHAFWLKLARHGEPVYVPEIVCIHRRHLGNRLSPSKAANYYQLITDVAQEDQRLAPCVPRRRGVQLCELSIDAVHQRSVSGLVAAASPLLSGGHQIEVLRAAATHWRDRRDSASEGATLLSTDTNLRDWLATYQ